MKLIREKYRKLKPQLEYLNDEVVIAQAWKKTHSYMRTHNWYADTLALDISALGLEENAKTWSKYADNLDRFKPHPLDLVPASKSEPWIVDGEGKWRPESPDKRKKKIPVRPLAHMTVRDQTLSSALMLCLADSIETRQGDCGEPDFLKAQQKKVYSYGNRLLCDWRGSKAWFRWGNAETFRKFFVDYQSFLNRPLEIGRSVAANDADSDHVFIVNLDLTKFFDHIDRAVLIERLKELSTEASDEGFWSAAEKITNWKWSPQSKVVAEKLGLDLKEGLPQGLVSAGFFANAYMIPFDEEVGRQIGEIVPGSSRIVLQDYCRYVDDLRLVVSVEDVDALSITDAINTWVAKLLFSKVGKDLCLNKDKTKVTVLSDLDNSGSITGRLRMLQDELSGPADRDVLENATGILEGLLALKAEGIPDELPSSED
ncbi:MAG: RNA-directed DNA polymerase, partial [Kiritimatiellales bacterium]|nr:RNA-directed DNA polymerase [Kiritimatiellales bacterium]